MKKRIVSIITVLTVFAAVGCANTQEESGAVIISDTAASEESIEEDTEELAEEDAATTASTIEEYDEEDLVALYEEFHDAPVFIASYDEFDIENPDDPSNKHFLKGCIEKIELDADSKKQYPELAASLEKLVDSRFEEAQSIKQDYLEMSEEDPDIPYDLYYTYNIKRCDSHYVSVICYAGGFGGGAHPWDDYEVKNFDVKTGKEILISQFIPDKEKLYSYIRDYYINKSENFYSDWEEELLKEVENSYLDTDTINNSEEYMPTLNWTCSAKGIDIDFDNYTLAPRVGGDISLFIPYSADIFEKGNTLLTVTGDFYGIGSSDERLSDGIDLDGDGKCDRVLVEFSKDNPNAGCNISINDGKSITVGENNPISKIRAYMAITPTGKHCLLLICYGKEDLIYSIALDSGVPEVVAQDKNYILGTKRNKANQDNEYLLTSMYNIKLRSTDDNKCRIYYLSEDGRFMTQDK
ncbi:MAG: DUF4163 domain-containing protein [Butyrivibrio sp.]|nr:DUF4163 domain-containing protein [Butyrivibrio sp.]